MATRRKGAGGAAAARLAVLAQSDPKKAQRLAMELLAEGGRIEREAALAALAARPAAEAREALRALFFELHADGLKRDQGAAMRAHTLTILRAIGDRRDADVAVLACDAHEIAFGEDIAWRLRAQGLMTLADLAPELLPYFAIEMLDDRAGDGEPANTAFQLLAGLEQHALIYQWLLRADPADPLIAGVFELFAEGPRGIVERYATEALRRAARGGNETLATTLVDAIVRLELEACYRAIGELMHAKISDELYHYLALLLAGTNRPPLLALLDEQLHRGRRPRVIAEALRLRPTPESAAILRAWEDGD
jgi:hypothetical protein